MSNWSLYIGIFLCCTGVGVIPGAILIFIWGITHLTENNKTTRSSEERRKWIDTEVQKINREWEKEKKRKFASRWKGKYDPENLEGWK